MRLQLVSEEAMKEYKLWLAYIEFNLPLNTNTALQSRHKVLDLSSLDTSKYCHTALLLFDDIWNLYHLDA